MGAGTTKATSGGGGITLRSSSIVTQYGLTNITPTNPTGSVAGDFLVLCVWQNDTSASGFAPNTPAGWTLAAAPGGVGDELLAVYYRVSNGTMPTFSEGGSGTYDQIAVMLAIQNVNATPISAAYSQTTSTNTATQAAPSVSTAQTNDLLISMWGTNPLGSQSAGKSYSSFGTSTLAQQGQVGGNGFSFFAVATQVVAASGATGTRSATASYSATSEYIAANIAIRHA